MNLAGIGKKHGLEMASRAVNKNSWLVKSQHIALNCYLEQDLGILNWGKFQRNQKLIFVVITSLVRWIIGLSFLSAIICFKNSLYLTELAEFLLPSEGKAVTLWSQNRTLANGTCRWQKTSWTTMVKFGGFSFVLLGSWIVKHVFFC